MAVSRRAFAKNAAAAVGALGLSSFAEKNPVADQKKLKIVCVGGHPDDPETGCGGTLAKFIEAGSNVTIIYLTTGEAGIVAVSHKEAAATRKAEAEAACKVLKAKPVFAGQIDGDTIVNSEWIKKMGELIATENPDIVFTHWPIDSHKDHQAASFLTMQAWMRSGKKFELYFFEVCSGSQTTGFRPDTYIDISTVQHLKKKAVYCHTSQDPDAIYNSKDCNHGMMEKFRGIEMNVTAAEAFVRMDGASGFQNMLSAGSK
jgi:LmbE family N-acetylglucosaminyl deacetylase